jgi:RimJ/RimL family protein N-acetyltransferase
MNVTLRDVAESDFPILFEYQRDPEGVRMAAFPSREWDAFVVHWTTKILADETVIKKTILVDGHVAGDILSFVEDGKRLVGYWIGTAYWGKGIATLALGAFLLHDAARPLYADIAKHNVASRRVLEKCGFSICGPATLSGANGEEVEGLLLYLPG